MFACEIDGRLHVRYCVYQWQEHNPIYWKRVECVQSRDTQNHIYFTIRDALKSYDDIEVEGKRVNAPIHFDLNVK